VAAVTALLCLFKLRRHM